MNLLKKIISISILGAFLALSSCEKEKVVPAQEFPSEIETYVSSHFPSNKIIQVVEDQDGLSKTYDVILDGNINLEFNNKMEIIEIDANNQLPESVIPDKIKTYVNENFPNNTITDWKIDDKNQEIKLDSGLEIKFTMEGDLIRIDN